MILIVFILILKMSDLLAMTQADISLFFPNPFIKVKSWWGNDFANSWADRVLLYSEATNCYYFSGEGTFTPFRIKNRKYRDVSSLNQPINI